MTDNISSDSIRLNKFLALELGISRREADIYIEKGRIKINTTTASLGARFNNSDKIYVDNKILEKQTKFYYLALNKPRGYVCSRRKQGENPTIYDLIPVEFHNLKPVGRLDCDSSGLIILTNDGDFAYQMTHPKFYKTKIYFVRLNKDLEPLHQQMISDYGITLEDGPSKLQLERLDDFNRKEWKITMHEGRNRQIRRTFSSLGYDVIALHRVQFGSYQIGNLKSGDHQLFKIN